LGIKLQELAILIQFLEEKLAVIDAGHLKTARFMKRLRERLQGESGKLPTSSLVGDILSLLEGADLESRHGDLPLAAGEIREGLRRLARLVGVQGEPGEMPAPRKILLDVNRTLTTTLNLARGRTRELACVETDFGKLPLLPADPALLAQAFEHLLENAVQAIAEVVGSPPCGKGIIVVKTRRLGEAIEVLIGDTGAGIPFDRQPALLEKLAAPGGCGPRGRHGLDIVRRVVVELHGGQLSFKSDPERGTTFYVRLPLDACCGDLRTS